MRIAIALFCVSILTGCGGDDTTSTARDMTAASGDLSTAPDDLSTDVTDLAMRGDGGAHAFVDVQVLALNDFHGHVGPPDVFNGSVLAAASDPATGSAPDTDMGTKLVLAGGAAYVSSHLSALRTGHANTVTVSAGDLTGASPLLASAFEDEPAIAVMNLMGLGLNAVGNHELDNGVNELLRLQYGGCGQPRGTAVSCATDMGFGGASFEYLAANVEYRPGQTVFPSYVIRHFGDAAVAFVGMTLSDRSPYTAGAIKNLTLDDEIATVNALVPQLHALGVAATVVLVHQGDSPPPGTTYDACSDTAGPGYTMAMKMDPSIDAIVSAHTHRAYNCTVNGKLLTSAASYGRVITEIDLHIDVTAGRVAAKTAQQHLVTRDVTPDPAVNAVVNTYLALTRAAADVDDGYTAADISNFADAASGQSAVGDLIADGMLASVNGAQVALMNPGGVRDGIQAARLYPTDTNTTDGIITFEKLKTVQPFANKLTSGVVSAADLREILEEQWKGQPYPKLLQIAGLTYRYSQSAAAGSKITKITVGGVDLDATATTRNISVVTNEFISAGGDGFVQFKTIAMTNPFSATGAIDVDATAAYTASHSQSSSMTALPIPSLQGRVFADP